MANKIKVTPQVYRITFSVLVTFVFLNLAVPRVKPTAIPAACATKPEVKTQTQNAVNERAFLRFVRFCVPFFKKLRFCVQRRDFLSIK